MEPLRTRLQGLAIWALGLLLAWTLPGALWRPEVPPAFPVTALIPALLAVLVLAVAAPLLAGLGGPGLATRRPLALLEAPPELLWAGLLLALWPAAWGPPGTGAWLLAFLAAALPAEVRWLAAAMPPEWPFPAIYGPAALRRVRWLVLRRLWGRWLAARLPLWLTATLVLERLLGIPGLGSDWMARVACRDRAGLAAWISALAVLWLLARPLERETP